MFLAFGYKPDFGNETDVWSCVGAKQVLHRKQPLQCYQSFVVASKCGASMEIIIAQMSHVAGLLFPDARIL